MSGVHKGQFDPTDPVLAEVEAEKAKIARWWPAIAALQTYSQRTGTIKLGSPLHEIVEVVVSALDEHRATRPPAGDELDADEFAAHLYTSFWGRNRWVKLTEFAEQSDAIKDMWRGIAKDGLAHRAARSGTGGGGDMVVVPRIPTPEMVLAAIGRSTDSADTMYADIYRAMLAAIPHQRPDDHIVGVDEMVDAEGLVAELRALGAYGDTPPTYGQAMFLTAADALSTLQAEVAGLKAEEAARHTDDGKMWPTETLHACAAFEAKHGVFVSSSAYTDKWIARAEAAEARTQALEGERDGLAEKVRLHEERDAPTDEEASPDPTRPGG